ncbi:hypothetical protein BS50DRAFT_638079 [Corynespora cassiicola Philippines]|uniref:Uncharacterized protein n=1 Tax=Corynespora cassiicola Philippines TaxID=1448308 RepID=A0A2T2NAM2_CORCC|nr:hypothetical protein BS50DRAFT_638079 [Corynespora cassiicola Philippines]
MIQTQPTAIAVYTREKLSQLAQPRRVAPATSAVAVFTDSKRHVISVLRNTSSRKAPESRQSPRATQAKFSAVPSQGRPAWATPSPPPQSTRWGRNIVEHKTRVGLGRKPAERRTPLGRFTERRPRLIIRREPNPATPLAPPPPVERRPALKPDRHRPGTVSITWSSVRKIYRSTVVFDCSEEPEWFRPEKSTTPQKVPISWEKGSLNPPKMQRMYGSHAILWKSCWDRDVVAFYKAQRRDIRSNFASDIVEVSQTVTGFYGRRLVEKTWNGVLLEYDPKQSLPPHALGTVTRYADGGYLYKGEAFVQSDGRYQCKLDGNCKLFNPSRLPSGRFTTCIYRGRWIGPILYPQQKPGIFRPIVRDAATLKLEDANSTIIDAALTRCRLLLGQDVAPLAPARPSSTSTWRIPSPSEPTRSLPLARRPLVPARRASPSIRRISPPSEPARPSQPEITFVNGKPYPKWLVTQLLKEMSPSPEPTRQIPLETTLVGVKPYPRWLVSALSKEILPDPVSGRPATPEYTWVGDMCGPKWLVDKMRREADERLAELTKH